MTVFFFALELCMRSTECKIRKVNISKMLIFYVPITILRVSRHMLIILLQDSVHYYIFVDTNIILKNYV